MLPSMAATWQGVSPCFAAVVGERSVNLSSHLEIDKRGWYGETRGYSKLPFYFLKFLHVQLKFFLPS